VEGTWINKYRILSLLGEGGMGSVYLAEDTKLHRKVTLKFLSSSLAQDNSRLHRFEQEARAVSALNHPNILTIHEISEEDGRPFIVAEFIEGQTLRERLHSPFEVDDAIEIATQVASALVAAHRVNIIHRDIKPENIMIRTDDGLVKLLDFGLAKIAEGTLGTVGSNVDKEGPTQFKTAPGVVMGTVAYMSPEQARGAEVDERTDIWSLGVVLYEMLAGAPPFVATTANEIIGAILSREPAPPLTRSVPHVPERLPEIVEKALAKNRDERHQTARDLLFDLKRLKHSLDRKGVEGGVPRDKDSVAASDSVGPYPGITAHHRSLRFGVIASSVAAILLCLATGGLFYAWRLRQASHKDAISSIAVLPFTNSNSDPDTEFLSDGITDNIIDRLSQLPELRVTSHTAVFHYRGKETDPRTIGKELGVEAILTGRVAKHLEELTIRLELVDARDDRHLWGEQYDRRLSDLLAVQREIPLDVTDKLRLRLSGGSKERLTRGHTDNTVAYELYLKGRYSWEKFTAEGTREAVYYFEQAIKKDANYALAYSGLADAYMVGNGVEGLPQKEAHRRAREAATKALSLDPELGEAHAALAEVLLYDDWDFAGSERAFKRALELNPNYAEAHHLYSHLLLLLGRTDESLSESKKYLELDPLSDSPIHHLGFNLLYARRYDDAIKQFKKEIELYPNSVQPVQFHLGDAYYEKGLFNEAIEAYLKGFARYEFPSDSLSSLRKAFARAGTKGFYLRLIEEYKTSPSLDPVNIARVYARIGQKEHAFEWLERAYAEHSHQMVRLKEEIDFDSLRSDARFTDLLRRVGLPQ
jgi:serine/threonine-protein kinase